MSIEEKMGRFIITPALEPVVLVIGEGEDEWFFALGKGIGEDVVDKAMRGEADPECEPEELCPIRRIFSDRC